MRALALGATICLSAKLDLGQTCQIVDALMEVHGNWLPDFS